VVKTTKGGRTLGNYLPALAVSTTALVESTLTVFTTFVVSAAVLQVSHTGVASVLPSPPQEVNVTAAKKLSATNVTFFILIFLIVF
jgi:hypothetical protein